MEVTNTKIRAAIYCRESMDTDAGKKNLEKQKDMLHQYAEQQGYEITSEIIEIAKDDTLDRDGIQQIYQLCHDQNIDIILIETSSRITRSIALIKDFYNKINYYDIKIISRTEGALEKLISEFE